MEQIKTHKIFKLSIVYGYKQIGGGLLNYKNENLQSKFDGIHKTNASGVTTVLIVCVQKFLTLKFSKLSIVFG